MTTVYLALGSNVGDPASHIEQTVELLSPLLGNLKRAPLYLSKAVGYTDQPDFVNTAISGTTDLAPETLLGRLKNIEQQIGRTPTFQNGPREIDIDIILYGDLDLRTADLTTPHPAFRQRDFVLQPLVDMDPDLVDPVSGQTVTNLLAKLPPEQKSIVRRVDAKP